MSTIPDYVMLIPPRPFRIPQLDPSAFPDLTVNSIQAEAAAHRNTANGVEALAADEGRLDVLVDKLVHLSPLPNWLDRMVIGYVVRFLAPAIREIADEIEATARTSGLAS